MRVNVPLLCNLLGSAALLLAHGTAHAADPTTADCLNANDRSIALRNQHQLRAARSELLVCAAPTCPEDVRNECARRVAEVNAQMPTVVFEAKDRQGNDLSAVSVSMDGQPLVNRLEGTALSIDPGEHQFVFTTAGAPPVHKRWVINESEKGRREKIVLGPEPAEAAPAPLAPPGAVPLAPPAAATQVALESPPPPAASPSGGSHALQRTLGIVIGGVGCVGLGVALVEQINAKNHEADSQRAAQSSDPAVGATTHGLYEQAKHAQTAAIVFAAVGATALGAGLTLFLTGLKDPEPRDRGAAWQLTPEFGPAGASLHYARTF